MQGEAPASHFKSLSAQPHDTIQSQGSVRAQRDSFDTVDYGGEEILAHRQKLAQFSRPPNEASGNTEPSLRSSPHEGQSHPNTPKLHVPKP